MREPRSVPEAFHDPTPPSAGSAPSRHILTLLFSDLSHSTRLGALLEAESYAGLIDQLHAVGTAIVARHGGVVARIQGDGLLAVFGHPRSAEDDVRRAADAALELHAAVRALPAPPGLPADLQRLTLHSGLHSGLVLVGEGDVMRGRLELTGHAPNIAARLAQEAGADEILVSESSLGPERRIFVTVARRQIVPRGTEQPLAVCGITGRAGALRRFEALKLHGLAPYVGRARERERLRSALRALVPEDGGGGRGALLVIGGGVGVGKTRLAEELLREAEARGARVHRGWCEAEPVAEALQPWRQMLRAQGEANPPASVPALVECFATLCAQGPQLLFVDDWQWADDASHHALRALSALGREAPLLLVLTQRGPPGGGASLAGSAPASLTLIELGALDADDAQQAVEHLVPGVSPFLRDAIVRQAGGNPLFIEELCHAAAAAGAPPLSGAGHVADAATASPSAWLDALIASRVARLPAGQARLVRCAAVLGQSMPGWLFERVSGVGLLDADVQALADEDLLYPDVEQRRLVFKHGVARDAIYRAVGLADRSHWHQLAAGALHEAAVAPCPPGQDADALADEHVEALAWHYAAAGLPAAAARMAERAGDKALAASSLDRAKAHFRATLRALDRLESAPGVSERWLAVAQRLGLACVFDADAADLPTFRQGVERAVSLADPPGEARMRYWLAYVAYGVGDLRASIAQGEQALALARRVGDDRLAMQLAAMLGQACAAAADYPRALPLLDAAIAVKRQHRSGSGLAVGLNYTLAVKATLLADQGAVEPADALFAEALAPVRGLNHQVEASILGLQAAALLWQGRDEEALASAEHCWRIGERVRSLFTCAMGRSAASFARWRLGRGSGRAELDAVAESTRWLTERGVNLFGSLNQGWLAEMQCAAGDPAAARHAAVAALVCARRGDWWGLGMAGRAMARLHAAGGEPARGGFWLRQARRAARKRGSPTEHALNDRIAVQTGTA